MYGDPAAIRALATQVDGAAEGADDEARRLRGATGVAWRSSGADRYLAQLGDDADAVTVLVGELEQAAQAVRDHADAVEARLEQIAAAQRWFGNAVDDARSLWDRGIDALTSLPRILSVSPPAPGSLEWLDFTDGLGR